MRIRIVKEGQRADTGFTIVELLIVVVVIAVLAAVTIVAYNGISRQAVESSMKADLRTAATTLELDKTKVGNYPSAAASANDGKGLRASGDSTLSYETTSYGYCVSVSNSKSSTSLRMRSDLGQIEEGQCSVVITALAGVGSYGYVDGTGAAARFSGVRGIAVDTAGNIYVPEMANHRIRKVTPGGVVTTLAGSGASSFANGTGAAARFSYPNGVAVDGAGNVYVADYNNQRIRKITPSGVVTTLAGSGATGFVDGTGTAAQFHLPSDVAVDSTGNVYVTEINNRSIRKITPSGVVTTLAGSGVAGYADGTGAAAQFNNPSGVAVDSAGNIYVADYNNHRIRKATPSGVVTTLAGSGVAGYADGTGAAAQFNNPSGVAVDSAGNVYVADYNNQRIRKITPSGVVTTLAGTGVAGHLDGTGVTAQLNYPYGVAVDGAGNVYSGDYGSIRKIEQ